jgi:prepilin-type N-terminal cleavage/methylation domain-containing protein
VTGARSAERGFTFVELVVVLAIMAFAFTYGVVHLDGATDGARLASAARQIGSTLEFHRGHAVQSGRPLELHLDIERGEWRTVVPPRPSEAEKERRREEEVLVTDPVALPRDIRFEGVQLDASEVQKGGVLVITFTPLGEMVPNGFMVRLVSDVIDDQQAGSFSVEVNGLTGEVTYEPGYATFEQVVKGDSF